MAISIKEFEQHQTPTPTKPKTIEHLIIAALTKHAATALTESELMHATNTLANIGGGGELVLTIKAFVTTLNLLIKSGRVLAQEIPGAGKHYALSPTATNKKEVRIKSDAKIESELSPTTATAQDATTAKKEAVTKPVIGRHRIDLATTLAELKRAVHAAKGPVGITMLWKHGVQGLATISGRDALFKYFAFTHDWLKRNDIVFLKSRKGTRKYFAQESRAGTMPGVDLKKSRYVNSFASSRASLFWNWFIQQRIGAHKTLIHHEKFGVISREWKTLSIAEQNAWKTRHAAEFAHKQSQKQQFLREAGLPSVMKISVPPTPAVGNLDGAMRPGVQLTVQDMIASVYDGISTKESLLNALNQLFYFGKLTKWDFRHNVFGNDDKWDVFVMRTLRYVDDVARAYDVAPSRVTFENGNFICELKQGNKKTEE